MHLVVLYLASHLLSLLGNGIAAVALPLIVLQTTGSPLGMAALAASTAIPSFVVGLASGVVIDRINRRTASVASDLVSAAAIAALPLVDLAFGLNIGWFIVLGILGAIGDVPGTTAREVLAPLVAERAGVDLRRMIGVRQACMSVALVLGPALAGMLMATVGATASLWITASTSGLAAVLTLFLPRAVGAVAAAPRAAGRRSAFRDFGEGLGVVRRSPFLLAAAAIVVGLAVALGGLQGLVMPLYFGILERPDLLGLVLTAIAAGMLVGAAGYAALASRLRQGAWLAIGFTLTTAGLGLMASLAGPPVVFAGAAALGLGNAVVGAVVGVMQVERTDGAVRGRVFSVTTALLTLAAPAGIGLAGVVAEFGSPVLAALAVVAIWPVVLAVVLASRALRAPAPEAADAQR